ncbi:MAG: hypothetical protein JSR81_14385, partial [Proteobacteria bacterium]|nr:hypothetical protein [Pseudomonadota bacterium]
MNAREDILNAIRAQRVRSAVRPAAYTPSPAAADPVAAFAERAAAVNAQVRILDNAREIPQAIADLLRGKNLPAEIHIAPDARAM